MDDATRETEAAADRVRLRRRAVVRMGAAGLGTLCGAALLAACGDGMNSSATPTRAAATAITGTSAPAANAPTPAASGQLTLYASVPQNTLDLMLGAFKKANPALTVNLFRNGTGPVSAKIAAERKAGKIQADLVWLAEPTAIQNYAQMGLLAVWTPPDAPAVPEAYQGAGFWGTRIINVAIGYHKGATAPKPTDWKDLTNATYKGKIGIPNPNFAGSTLGALGYFTQNPQYGFAYYQALASNGAVQLQGNQEVADGIAQGRFDAGFALDYMAMPMAAKGAPIELVWPSSGPIAVYSPVALFKDAANVAAGQQFINFVLSKPGQELLAAQSFQPIRPDVPYNGVPTGVKAVQPDWNALLKNQQDLLDKYGAIFPG